MLAGAFLCRSYFRIQLHLNCAIAINQMSAFSNIPGGEANLGDFYTTDITSFPLITNTASCTNAIKYSHLLITVSNMAASIAFYEKIGFNLLRSSSNVHVLRNVMGFELHLVPCRKPVEDGKNILMDFPTEKYPGHTHFACTVSSVPAIRTYLDALGIPLSGERPGGGRTASVFIRDPDRTVVELENNVADDPTAIATEIYPQSIGRPRGVDHVGIRVSNAESAWLWYAEKLGFVRNVMRYELHPEPLKNFRPFISRTNSGIDINFLLNANVKIDGQNILTVDSVTRPGIIYIAYEVPSVRDAEERLAAAGVATMRDAEICGGSWGLIAGDFEMSAAGEHNPPRPSIFLRDEDLNLIRLVESV